MPLSILDEMLNTKKTFSFALCFITSETTTSFEFIEDQLDDLFFFNCSRPKIICGDFAKRLTSAIARREAEHQQAGHGETYILQIYEWYGVEEIKRHLVAADKYPKDLRKKIIDLIWKQVKSSSPIELEANRTALLQQLLPKEQEYLLVNYQPKERQFIRAYTRSYPNLGVNSAQRSESYHSVIKSLVNRQMPIAEFVRQIKEHIQEIRVVYDADINKQRTKAPRLLVNRAFAKIKYLLTWLPLGKLYHLLLLVIFSLMYTFEELLAKEWEATKQMGHAIEGNGEEETYFNMNDCDSQCLLECELPL